MHPYIIDGVLSSYSLMLIIGIFSALGLFKFLTKHEGISKEVYDFYSTAAVVAIAVGLCSAFLFQSVYNFLETGVFKISGLTFMGGLIGGVVTFILITVFSRKKYMRAYFFPAAELAVLSIALGLAIGRIGCFLAGCCYGVRSEHGVQFPHLPYKVLPTQLYESIFVFIVFAVLLLIVLKFKRVKGFNLIIFSYSYAIFRFIIEFFRGDPRGAYIGAISPSQFQSIVLFLVASALLFLRLYRPNIVVPDIEKLRRLGEEEERAAKEAKEAKRNKAQNDASVKDTQSDEAFASEVTESEQVDDSEQALDSDENER